MPTEFGHQMVTTNEVRGNTPKAEATAKAGPGMLRETVESLYNQEAIMNAEPVYMELVDFVARGSTAEEVANFRPSPEARKRVAALLERQRESEPTEEETADMDGFVGLNTSLV